MAQVPASTYNYRSMVCGLWIEGLKKHGAAWTAARSAARPTRVVAIIDREVPYRIHKYRITIITKEQISIKLGSVIA